MIRQSLLLAEKAWRWWLSAFVALLPRTYLERLIPSRLTLILKAGDAGTDISVMAGDQRLVQETITFPVDSEEVLSGLKQVIDGATKGKRFDVIGVVPERESLARPLTLPLAAKAHVDDTVRYQIERLSPFKANNTLYDIKQLESDGAANELRLKLTIVSRDSVADLEERGAKCGFRIDHFAIKALNNSALEKLAFRSEAAARAKVPFEAKALVAAAFILVASLLLVPIIGKWKEAETLESEVSLVKPKAEQVLKLQSERDKIIALRAQMVGLKKAALPPIAILSKLSELLDDETFLVDMRMERAAVTISGLSSDASKLAQRLGTVEGFKSVKFSGPVMRDAQAARDRFTLILEMAARS